MAVAWRGRKEKPKSPPRKAASTTANSIEYVNFGGAEGIRTLDLLDAIEARSQLRHGPTGNNKTSLTLACGSRPERRLVRAACYNGEMSGCAGDEVSFRRWAWRKDERRGCSRSGVNCAFAAGVGGGVCGVGAEDQHAVSNCAGDCGAGAELCAWDSQRSIESGSCVSGGVAAAVVQRRLADIVAGFSRKFCEHFYVGRGTGGVYGGWRGVCRAVGV